MSSFQSLMEELKSHCQLVVVPKNSSQKIILIDKISPTQKKAFKLLNIKLL